MCFFFRSLGFFTQWGCQQKQGESWGIYIHQIEETWPCNPWRMGRSMIKDLWVTKIRENIHVFCFFSQLFYMSQIANHYNHNPLTGPLLGLSDPVAKPRSGRRWRSMRGGSCEVRGIPGKHKKKHWILSCFKTRTWGFTKDGQPTVGTTCGQDSNSNGDAKRGCSPISTIGVVDISPVMIFFSLDDWDFIIEPMSASEFTRISIRTGCFWHESRFTIGFESQRSIKIHHSEWCGKPNAINHPQITIFMGCINKPQLVVVHGIGFLSLFTISLSINNHYLESSWSLVY